MEYTGIQKPSIGRIVHYRSGNEVNWDFGTIYPAIITSVHNDLKVGLTVFTSDGIMIKEKIPYSINTPMSWFWPPRI